MESDSICCNSHYHRASNHVTPALRRGSSTSYVCWCTRQCSEWHRPDDTEVLLTPVARRGDLNVPRFGIGCHWQNSSNCDQQHHLDKNSRLLCSGCLTYAAENTAVLLCNECPINLIVAGVLWMLLDFVAGFKSTGRQTWHHVLSSCLRIQDTARDFGVVIDSQLSLSAHVAVVCRSGYTSSCASYCRLSGHCLKMQIKHRSRRSFPDAWTTVTLCS